MEIILILAFICLAGVFINIALDMMGDLAGVVFWIFVAGFLIYNFG